MIIICILVTTKNYSNLNRMLVKNLLILLIIVSMNVKIVSIHCNNIFMGGSCN